MPKKVISVILCLIISFSLFPAVSYAAGTKYSVNVQRANILDNPRLTANAIADIQKGDTVYVLYDEGDFSYVTVNSTGVSGWVYTPLLTYVPSVTDTGINSIQIKKKPDTLIYTEGESEFDETGLRVVSVSTEGKKEEISGYKIYAPSLDTYGKKTVYVTYTPANTTVTYSANFEITVNKVPLTSLTVTASPTKKTTSYIENQKADYSGLKLKATYSDRKAEIFTWDEIKDNPDFVFSVPQGTKLSKGTTDVSIYYKYPEISCSLSFSAREKKVVSLTLTKQPDDITVYTKTVPNLSGIELCAVYDNAEDITVYPTDCTVTCDTENLIYGSQNKLIFTYGGESATLYFTYALDEITGIKLKLPELLSFIQGEPIDLSELEVYYVYLSGKTEKCDDWTRSKIDPMQTEAQTVVVTAGAYSSAFTVFINPYYRKGDIDGDGKVTSADARLALRASVGYINIANKPFTAADVNSDNAVTSADARLILRCAVGLEDFLKDIRNTTV